MRVTSKIIRILTVVITALIILTGILFLALNLPFTQRIITKKINRVMEQNQLPVRVGSIDRLLPHRLIVSEVLIISADGDTLVFAEELESVYSLTGFLRSRVDLDRVVLKDMRVEFSRMQDETDLDIATAFSRNVGTKPDKKEETEKEKEEEKKKEEKEWTVHIGNGRFDRIRFGLKDVPGGLDISQQFLSLRIGNFMLAPGKRQILLESLELRQGLGTVILSEKVAEPKESSGLPWTYGIESISLSEIRNRFESKTDSLLIGGEIGEGRIEIREMDLSGKKMALDRLMLSGTRVSLYSAPRGESDEPKGTTKPVAYGTAKENASTGLFPWDISGTDISLVKVDLEAGTYPPSPIQGSAPGRRLTGLELDIPRFAISGSKAMLRLASLRFGTGDGFSLEKMSAQLESAPGSTRLGLEVKTGESQLTLEGSSDRFLLALLQQPIDPGVSRLRITESAISPSELETFSQNLGEAEWFAAIAGSPIQLEGEFHTAGAMLDIDFFTFRQEHNLDLQLRGSLSEPLEPDRSSMNIQLEISDLQNDWIRELLTTTGSGYQVPVWNKLDLNGRLTGPYQSPAFDLEVLSDLGNLMLGGEINVKEKSYQVHSKADRILLGAWLDSEELGAFSGSLDIRGRGITTEEMAAELGLQIDSLVFKGYPYKRIRLSATMEDETIDAVLEADDPALNSRLITRMEPFGEETRLALNGTLTARLHELGLYADSLLVEGEIDASLKRLPHAMEAICRIDAMKFDIPGETITVDSLHFDFSTDATGTRLTAFSDFMQFDAGIGVPSDSLGTLGNAYSNYLTAILHPTAEDSMDRIGYLPSMDISSSLTYHPAMGYFLKDTTLWFSKLHFNLSNTPGDQSVRYHITGNQVNYKVLSTKNLTASLVDSAGNIELQMEAMDNLIAESPAKEIGITSSYSNGESLTGFSLINRFEEMVYQFEVATSADSSRMLISVPLQEMTFNRQRWVMPDPQLAIVDLETRQAYPAFVLQNDRSEIQLSTSDSATFRTFDLNLKEVSLTSLVPDSILPGNPMATISGGLDLRRDTIGAMRFGTDLTLSGMSWSGLEFEHASVKGSVLSAQAGDMKAELEATLDESGMAITMERQDSLLQSLDARFSELPVKTFQPFLNQYLADLKGSVSGTVAIVPGGNTNVLTGGVAFNNTAMRVKPLNASFRIMEDSLTFRNNRLVFNRFNVKDSLNNDLEVNGYVDFTNQRSPVSSLEINSNRIQVLNRSADEDASLYGNAFIDSRITVRGPLRNPQIRGRLLLSNGSELFYRHSEDLSLSESEKIITFVDHSEVDRPPPMPGAHIGRTGRTSIETALEIDPSTKIHFNLSKRIYNIGLVIQGAGSLIYQMQGVGQVTLSGRYQISDGAAEVKIVGWPNKTFRMTEGGYIQWDGRAEDPELNLEAVNRIRTSYLNPVDGNHREVDFNVVLRVMNRLSDLDILFTVNTPDQYLMSIINTLSPEEQMRQAITVLLFENVDLPGISSNSSYMTEQVNQLVASQLNQIAKTSIQGVDISFGIDSYQQATEGGGEQTRTSLSYEVRKNLMNERAQIEVSGRLNDLYSQPGASDFSLNNISFEYRLDSAGTRFLKVYNEHVYEDVFEGEVISTGVGFTYRKRYNRLGDIFRRDPTKRKNREEK